ncbi:MAG: hypothetical protein OJF50_003018 [Nitrospira sp.]|jgi:hypothetical protein|nr:hypothetical protein [Nitrospira sp.]
MTLTPAALARKIEKTANDAVVKDDIIEIIEKLIKPQEKNYVLTSFLSGHTSQ